MKAYRGKLLVSAAFFGAGLGGGAALAASGPGDVPVAVAVLDTVTISATLNPTSVFAYPGMVSVIDSARIETINPSTISDITRDIPSVAFGGGPRRTGEAPSIRGIGDQGVLVLIDGARQSFVSGHQGRFFLDPALIKSVEVVRGPASALYGSGALGGVMTFETADATDFLLPGETMGLRGRFSYQSANDEFLKSVSGFARIGIIDVVANISHRASDDIRLGDGSRLPSDDDILTSFGKVTADFGTGSSAALSYVRFRNDAIEPDNGQANNIGALVDKEVDTQTIAGQIHLDPMGTDFINLDIVPYLTRTSVGYTNPANGRRVYSDVDTTGIFTFGGEWYSDEHDGRDSTTIDGERPGVPDGENNFFGLFAQVETSFESPLGLPGRFSAIPGVRWDQFETSSPGLPDTEDSEISPKFALSYEPNPWLMFFGSYAEAFRAPGINELYLTGTHFVIPLGSNSNWTNVFQPNPNLKPEHATTWEFGAGLRFEDIVGEGDAFRLKAAYHASKVDDLINLFVVMPPGPPATCFFPPFVPCSAGTATSENVDAEIRGRELEAEYESHRIAINFNYSTLDGHERGTAYDLSSLTPTRLNATFILKVPEIDVSLGARLEIAGEYEKHYNPATHSPDVETRHRYSVVDLFGTWQPVGNALEGLRIDAGIENVAGSEYTRTFEGVLEPGRNFKAAVSYTVGW